MYFRDEEMPDWPKKFSFEMKIFLGCVIAAVMLASAWLTSFIYCLNTLTTASIALAVIDIFAFPVGIVHGVILWCHWLFG